MRAEVLIHKTAARNGEPFVALPNAVAQSDALSYQAKGLLAELLSRPNDWRVAVPELVNDHHGRDSIRAILAELIEAGHVVRIEGTKAEGGRFASHTYHVFDFPVSPEKAEKIRAEGAIDRDGFSGSGFAVAGQTAPTKKEGTEERGDKVESPDGDSTGVCTPGDEAGDSIDEAEKMALANSVEWRRDGEPGEEPVLIEAEDDEKAREKKLPWIAIKRALKENCPALRVIDSGDRRDGMIRKFWRENGRSIGAFEVLARRVAASDFLMARNGYEGNKGKPFGWGWIFDYREREEAGKVVRTPRWSLVLSGVYDNDRQEEIRKGVKEREAKKAEAGPKLSKVMIIGMTGPQFVDLNDKWDGAPRYKQYGTHDLNGLPEYMDNRPMNAG